MRSTAVAAASPRSAASPSRNTAESWIRSRNVSAPAIRTTRPIAAAVANGASPKLNRPRREQAVRDLKLNLRHFVVELLVSSYEATEDVGVNPTDLGSLCLLLLHGPAPAGRLAELTGLTTGAVTGVIDRLENGGFVRRELDPGDRRRVIVNADAARVDRDLFPHFPSL